MLRDSEKDSYVEGVCKRCDYIIVSEIEKTIFFIEMKKGNHKDKKSVSHKFMNSQLIFDYIKSVLFLFSHHRICNYEKCFILYCAKNHGACPVDVALPLFFC